MSAIDAFPVFLGRDGQALDDGYIYIGRAGMDAQSNPVLCYWDSGFVETASQPIRTLGGYPAYQGAPGRLFTRQDAWSLTVLDRFGRTVILNAQYSRDGFVYDWLSDTYLASFSTLHNTGVSIDASWLTETGAYEIQMLALIQGDSDVRIGFTGMTDAIGSYRVDVYEPGSSTTPVVGFTGPWDTAFAPATNITVTDRGVVRLSGIMYADGPGGSFDFQMCNASGNDVHQCYIGSFIGWRKIR